MTANTLVTAFVKSYIVWWAGFDMDGSVNRVLIRHCIMAVSRPKPMQHFFVLSYPSITILIYFAITAATQLFVEAARARRFCSKGG
jgi:hypothetical protein